MMPLERNHAVRNIGTVTGKPVGCAGSVAVPTESHRLSLACTVSSATLPAVSTVSEIEQAIELLAAADREGLESRLLARRFGLDALNDDERTELLASLDAAEAEIEAGRFHSADELRQSVRA